MKTDTTTKLLLAAVAGALWTLALRPVLAPAPAVAQGAMESVDRPAIAIGERAIYVAERGRIYRFLPELGNPAHVGAYGPNTPTRAR